MSTSALWHGASPTLVAVLTLVLAGVEPEPVVLLVAGNTGEGEFVAGVDSQPARMATARTPAVATTLRIRVRCVCTIRSPFLRTWGGRGALRRRRRMFHHAPMVSTRVTYRDLLRIRDVRHISAAMLFSRLASSMWSVALVLFVLLSYQSSVLAGLCAFANIAPGLVVSPLMGALLDRHHRARLVIVDYCVSATTMVLLATLSWLHELTPALLVALVSANSLTNSLSSSGMRASLPLLLSREKWDRANAIDAIIDNLATMVGPALAGFAIGIAGSSIALLLIALLRCAAAVMLVGIDIGYPRRERRHVMVESWQGIHYVVHHATLRGTALSIATANLADGALVVCLPILVFSRFHGDASAVGILWACGGIASTAVSMVIGRFHTEGVERRLYVVGILLSGVGIAVVAGSSTYAVAGIGLLVFGCSAGFTNLGAWAMRQRRTDPHLFGRVLAISMALNICGQPIGAGLAGVSARWSVGGTLTLGVGCVIVGALLALWQIPRRDNDVRDIEAGRQLRLEIEEAKGET